MHQSTIDRHSRKKAEAAPRPGGLLALSGRRCGTGPFSSLSEVVVARSEEE